MRGEGYRLRTIKYKWTEAERVKLIRTLATMKQDGKIQHLDNNPFLWISRHVFDGLRSPEEARSAVEGLLHNTGPWLQAKMHFENRINSDELSEQADEDEIDPDVLEEDEPIATSGAQMQQAASIGLHILSGND